MPTLLIIDDIESVRESLKHVFSRYGYTVVVAESGEAGLALYAKGGIDAALVDINMPGLNGVQVCRMICEQAAKVGKPGKTFPIWLMTGAIAGYIEDLGLEAGALEVLHKPFDIQKFADDLAEQLKKNNPS
jgi:DNA-binding response OmpR family regulator